MIFLPTDDKKFQASPKNRITINRGVIGVAVSILVMILAFDLVDKRCRIDESPGS